MGAVTVAGTVGGDVSAGIVAWTLTAPADDGDFLLFCYAGDERIGLAWFTVAGDPTRRFVGGTVTNTNAKALMRVYPLRGGDEAVSFAPTDPTLVAAFGALHVTGGAPIPVDWAAQMQGAVFDPAATISADGTMIADGVLLGAGIIGPSAPMTEPAGWTLLADVDGHRHVQVIYRDAAAGAFSDAWVDGTVSADGAGTTAQFGAHDLALRFGEAGGWVGSSSYALPPAGSGEGLARQFPAPRDLPATAPPPTPVVVPTPPWDRTVSPHRRR